jgi:O-antigen ligase
MHAQDIVTRLTIFLVTLAGCVLALYAGVQVTEGDLKVPLFVLALFLLILIWFGARQWLMVFLVASIFLRGQLNFLPFGFSLFETLMVLVIAQFILECVVFRKQGIRLGPSYDFFVLCCISLILFGHWAEKGFGMRIFGSEIWGGRGYVTIYLAIITYLIIHTLRPSHAMTHWLPLAVVAVHLFDVVVEVATSRSSAAAFFVYKFYSGISSLALKEDVTGRLGSFGNLGGYGVIAVLTYVSLTRLWRPNYWVWALLYIGAFMSCVFSGYRSSLLGFALMTFAAALRDLRGKAIVVCIVGAVFIAFLPLVHSHLIPLPKQAQRALVFLPGEWDRAMVEDANNSNEFRLGVWNMWYAREFPKHPWLGRGIGYSGAEYDYIQQYRMGSREDVYEAFVYIQQLHNGFLSTIDTIGVIGGMIFIPWCLVQLVRAVRLLLRHDVWKQPPTLRWTCIFLFMWISSFWIGALTFRSFAPPLIIMVALMLSMRRRFLSGEYEKRPKSEVAAQAQELAIR